MPFTKNLPRKSLSPKSSAMGIPHNKEMIVAMPDMYNERNVIPKTMESPEKMSRRASINPSMISFNFASPFNH